ncbi:hypothetical protein DPMN_194962 [Dreissena polymorpha]|uniref:Uncharacterized protein n=1 Tax=Dreissena polymorpha TaxID=45954 RepID=A0A9D3Y2U6_DREPO|nr:hypothetical protein DPMN_194962 [Dreissena polymorpha]
MLSDVAASVGLSSTRATTSTSNGTKFHQFPQLSDSPVSKVNFNGLIWTINVVRICDRGEGGLQMVKHRDIDDNSSAADIVDCRARNFIHQHRNSQAISRDRMWSQDQLNFLIDESETMGIDGTQTHGSNAVISMLDMVLDTHGHGKSTCSIHADNCPGIISRYYTVVII